MALSKLYIIPNNIMLQGWLSTERLGQQKLLKLKIVKLKNTYFHRFLKEKIKYIYASSVGILQLWWFLFGGL